MPEDQTQPEDSVEVAIATAGQPDDELTVTENVKLELRGPDGELKIVDEVHNLVTTVGKGGIADQLLASPSIGKPTHMAIGTGTNAAVVGDTALQTEAARVAFTTKTRSTNVVTYVATFAAGTGTGAITEGGILNASSTGDLYNRAVFSVINKGALDSLTITWQTTVA